MNLRKWIAMGMISAIFLGLTACSAPDKQTVVPPADRGPHLFPAYVREKGEIKWGYIDQSGKFVIQPGYDNAKPFGPDGLAEVQQHGKSGLIDEAGNVVLDPVYGESSFDAETGRRTMPHGSTQKVFVNGVFRFDIAGSIAGSGWPAPFSREVQGSWRYGYVGQDGTVLIEPRYRSASPFADGQALVQTGENSFALIDPTGKTVRTLAASWPGNFAEGLISFQDMATKRYGYMAVTGEVAIPAQFNSVTPFSHGVAVVSQGKSTINGLYGLINNKGEFLIPAQYASLRPLGDGLYAAGETTEYYKPEPYLRKAILDQQGRRLTDFTYYDVAKVQDGLIAVTDETATFLLDKTGAPVSGFPRLDGSGDLTVQGALVQARIDGTLRYLTRSGKPVWQTAADDDTVVLDGSLRVLARKYRPDRFLRITYPELSGLADQKVQNSLNARLRKLFGIPDQPPATGTDRKDPPSSDSTRHFSARQIKNLLIIGQSGNDYGIGAAHGMPISDSYHFDLTTGNQYGLADLFKPGSRYQERLEALLAREVAARGQENGMGYFTKTPKIDLNQTFTVSPDQLTIYYYPYAIAPYAAGFPTFEIAWSDIADLINPNGAFWKSFH